MCQKSECKIKKKTRRVLKLWSIFLSCLKILISQVNVAIGMLDFFLFEEFRDLSLWEWSLRNILKAHLLDFLQNHTFRSKQCVFLGYSPRHKCVKCLDVSTGHVYFSRDIVFFDENVFPFETLNPNAGALLRKEILLLPNHLQPHAHGDANIDYHVTNHNMHPRRRFPDVPVWCFHAPRVASP